LINHVTYRLCRRWSRPWFSGLLVTLFACLLQPTSDVQQLTTAGGTEQPTTAATVMTTIELT